MSQRLNDYFVQEASEYLQQLERLLSLPNEELEPETLLRLARGVRGSARMAGAETVASVAERLEDAARSVASRTIVWSDEIRALVLQTVRDLQVLVRALNRWGPAEETRVRQALERWDEREETPVLAVSAGGGGEGRRGAEDGDSGDGGSGGGLGGAFDSSGGALPLIVPISALFFDDEGPHVITPAPRASGPVPIESLLLRGAAAAEAALALRPRVERAAATGSGEELRSLHEEIFDLVALSLSAATE